MYGTRKYRDAVHWLQKDDSSNEQIIDGAIEDNGKEYVVDFILPNCSEAEVNNVIYDFLSRGEWQALANSLQSGNLNDKKRAVVIEGAAFYADDRDFYERIVPNSPSIEKQPSVEWYIRNGCWTALGRLLKRVYIPIDKLRYVAGNAAELADEESFVAIVVLLCTRKKEKTTISRFVKRSRWSMIGCLQGKLPNELFGYVLSWAVENADNISFTRWILPTCDRNQTKKVAARLIKEKEWGCLRRWFQQKSNVDERQEILEIVLARGEEHQLDNRIFSVCSVSELYYLVVQLALKGWNIALCNLICNVERRKDSRDQCWGAKIHDLCNLEPTNVSAETPMKWAIRLGQPVVMRLLYESGWPSNAVLHTLCMEMEAETSAQDEPKYLSFIRKVTTTPRTLKSLCRLEVTLCLTEQDDVRQKDIKNLPLPELLKKYMMFSTEADPEECKLWLKENGCYSNYAWVLSDCPKYVLYYDVEDYDYFHDDAGYIGDDSVSDNDDYNDCYDFNHHDDRDDRKDSGDDNDFDVEYDEDSDQYIDYDYYANRPRTRHRR